MVMMVFMVMMMFVMMLFMFVVIIIVIIVMVMMLMLIIIVILVLQFITALLDLLDPGGAGGNTLKVKHAGIEDVLQFNVTVVTLKYACARLKCADNLADTEQLLGAYFRCLVQQYDVTELDLLDYQVLQVFLANILLYQVIAAAEFVAYAQGIYDSYYAVQLG